MTEELEARVRRLEDLQEINQLFIDYGAHLDAGRFDEYAKLFAREGEVKLGPMGKAKGPEAIQALMEKALGGNAPSFHIVTSPQVQLDGDRATSTVMWSVVRGGTDGTAELGMLGFHHDTLVREDGRWKFLERRGTMGLPAVHPDAG
jgi:hypothetical protein